MVEGRKVAEKHVARPLQQLRQAILRTSARQTAEDRGTGVDCSGKDVDGRQRDIRKGCYHDAMTRTR